MKPDLNKKKWTSVAIPRVLVVEIRNALPSTSYLNVTDFVRSAVRYQLHSVSKTQETIKDE
jgi:Arc/MetJ-type ribon-helix-helix transcriptional regulator